MLAKVLRTGACSYLDIKLGRIDIVDFFQLMRIADWNMYTESYMRSLSMTQD